MDQEASIKLRALEQRVNTLTVIVVLLAVGLSPIAGLIPLAVVGFLLALPILSFTHQWLPGIARNCGRVISYFGRLLNGGRAVQGRS